MNTYQRNPYLLRNSHFSSVHVVHKSLHLLRAGVFEDDDRMGAVAQPVQDAAEVGRAGGQDNLVGQDAGLPHSQGYVGELLRLG